jgi:putative metallohydrolase (TIGR04338 family)
MTYYTDLQGVVWLVRPPQETDMAKMLNLIYNGEWTEAPKRDVQRAKVYASEIALRERFKNNDRLADIDEARDLVQRVLRSKTYAKVCETFDIAPKRGISIIEGRNSERDAAMYYPWGEIKLPSWALQKVVVLHEMAHSVSTRFEHNWPFCEIFLALVGRFMGADDRDLLKEEFKNRNVKFRKPRKLSAEQRASLAARARKNFGHRGPQN